MTCRAAVLPLGLVVGRACWDATAALGSDRVGARGNRYLTGVLMQWRT